MQRPMGFIAQIAAQNKAGFDMTYRAGLCQVALVMLTLLTACTTQPVVVYQTVPLPIPDLPQWATIEAPALECLADGVYIDIAARDDAKSHRIKVLTSVLCSTWADPAKCREIYAPD